MITDRERRMVRALTEDQLAALIVAVEQFGDLMGDSHGVTGLHLNGDVAKWDWLLDEWLDAYEPARAPLTALHEARIAELELAKNAAWERHQQEQSNVTD